MSLAGCVGGGGVAQRAGQSLQGGAALDMAVKFHWVREGARAVACYLWSSLFTWWVARMGRKKSKEEQDWGIRRGGVLLRSNSLSQGHCSFLRPVMSEREGAGCLSCGIQTVENLWPACLYIYIEKGLKVGWLHAC